jgi:hypothetical protein
VRRLRDRITGVSNRVLNVHVTIDILFMPGPTDNTGNPNLGLLRNGGSSSSFPFE